MNRYTTLAAVLAIVALMASCANPSHLVVYQHSNLGVNAGMSPATNNFHVRIGLRREFAAVVPKYDDDPLPGMENEDFNAASAFIAGRMRVIHPMKTPEVTECIATGEAAINAADGNVMPKFVTELTQ